VQQKMLPAVYCRQYFLFVGKALMASIKQITTSNVKELHILHFSTFFALATPDGL
jgi:hypothetical protein